MPTSNFVSTSLALAASAGLATQAAQAESPLLSGTELKPPDTSALVLKVVRFPHEYSNAIVNAYGTLTNALGLASASYNRLPAHTKTGQLDEQHFADSMQSIRRSWNSGMDFVSALAREDYPTFGGIQPYRERVEILPSSKALAFDTQRLASNLSDFATPTLALSNQVLSGKPIASAARPKIEKSLRALDQHKAQGKLAEHVAELNELRAEAGFSEAAATAASRGSLLAGLIALRYLVPGFRKQEQHVQSDYTSSALNAAAGAYVKASNPIAHWLRRYDLAQVRASCYRGELTDHDLRQIADKSNSLPQASAGRMLMGAATAFHFGFAGAYYAGQTGFLGLGVVMAGIVVGAIGLDQAVRRINRHCAQRGANALIGLERQARRGSLSY